MIPTRVDETRLEDINSYEVDGAQPSPREVEFIHRMREVQFLQGEGDFACRFRYPPGLSVTFCLTAASGIADRIGRKGADHHSGVAEREDIVASVASIAEGSPGHTLPRSNSEGPIAMMESCRCGHNWSPGHLPFEDVGEDVTGVPKVLVQRRP